MLIIINRSPWNLDDNVFNIVEGSADRIPSPEAFHFIDLWMHVSGLWKDMVTEQVGRNLLQMPGIKAILIRKFFCIGLNFSESSMKPTS